MEKNYNWRELIKSLPISESYYSLDGKQNPDCLILDRFQNKWKVYYLSERGSIHNEQIFEAEEDACRYIYNELKETIARAKKNGLNF